MALAAAVLVEDYRSPAIAPKRIEDRVDSGGPLKDSSFGCIVGSRLSKRRRRAQRSSERRCDAESRKAEKTTTASIRHQLATCSGLGPGFENHPRFQALLRMIRPRKSDSGGRRGQDDAEDFALMLRDRCSHYSRLTSPASGRRDFQIAAHADSATGSSRRSTWTSRTAIRRIRVDFATSSRPSADRSKPDEMLKHLKWCRRPTLSSTWMLLHRLRGPWLRRALESRRTGKDAE